MRRRIPILLVLVITLVSAATPFAFAVSTASVSGGTRAVDAPQANIPVSLVASGLPSPTFVTAPAGDRARLFVVLQGGTIRLIKNGALLATPFLDIHTILLSGGERGLLSMAFHPNYATNGFFFVYYTDLSGNLQISRYHVSGNPDLADPNSGLAIITINHPGQSNHNGGQLQFGPDGYLYIGTGDGGSGGDPPNNAQNPAVLLGKMLRLDVDSGQPYTIPPSNPFAGPGDPRDEIWALGLRNPWRYSFDRLTGDLWIGDVGQGDWEEVDREPAGSAGGINWGWRCLEGTHTYNWSGTCPTLTLTPPVYEYSHSVGLAISGGYVYRGSPNSSFFGNYFFTDYYVSNRVWSLTYNGLAWVATQHTLVPPAGRTVNSLASFGQDATGDLYLADQSGGEIYKMELRPATCVSGNTDVNGDGRHDIVDVQLVAADFMRTDFVGDYDINCDGEVNAVDVTLTAAAWGT